MYVVISAWIFDGDIIMVRGPYTRPEAEVMAARLRAREAIRALRYAGIALVFAVHHITLGYLP